MATFTWTGTISSDWTVAGNWTPSGTPGNGDTAIINSGPTVQLLDLALVGNTIDLGGTTPVSFINDGSAISNLDSATAIDVTGTAATIDITGSVTDAGKIVVANSASLNIAVGPNGPIPGNLHDNGTISVGSGANLLITTSGSLDTFTPGNVVINGGTVVVDARIGGGGFFNIGSDSDLAINQLVTFGGGIDAAFNGPNAELKLDDPANLSSSFIPNFGQKNTIDIGQTTIGTLTYDGSQLALFDNSGTEFFSATVFSAFGASIQSGTFVVPGTGGLAGSLLIAQGSGQDTEISIAPPTTLSWKNSGAGALSDPSNWALVGGFGTIPASGDTLLIGMGTVLATDFQFQSNVLNVSSASLVIANDTGSFDASELDFLTVLTAAANVTLDTQGIVVDHGTINVTGNLMLDAEQFSNGTTTLAGLFDNHGTMTVGAGGMLSVSAGTNAGFANTEVIDDQGGTVRLGGGVLGVHGAWLVSQKGAIEVAAALPIGPTFGFADSSGNLLKIDALGSFQGRIDGFQSGNAIDFGSVNVGSVAYDSSTGLLTLINAGSTVGSLLLGTGVFPSVNGALDGSGNAGAFHFGTVGSDTILTTTQTNDVWTGGTAGIWSTGSNWSGGVPTVSDTAMFGPNTAGGTITSSATVGSLLMQDRPFAVLQVNAPLTVMRPIEEVWGNIQTNSGGTVTAPSVQQASASSDITFDVLGGTAVLTGSRNVINPAAGTVALVDTVNVSVVGSTLDAGGKTIPGTTGGYISIGQAAGGDTSFSSNMSVQNSFGTLSTPSTVFATYTMIGSDPTSFGQSFVSGTGTTWTDVGDAKDPNTRGYILIGVNSSSNLATPLGGALLQLGSSAVMTETTYAEIGANTNSTGTAEVMSGAEWVVGTGTSSFLDVGELGNGSLLVNNGGTVGIGGGGGTIVSNGTSSVARGGLGVGVGSGSTGTVVVGDTGFVFGPPTESVLTSVGKVGVGLQGQGVLQVASNGSVVVSGSNLGVGGFGGGAMGGSGTVAVTNGGQITIGRNLFVWQGSTISVDGTSAVVVGAGSVVAGNIQIGGTNELFGDGLINASVLDQGTVVSTNNGSFGSSNGGTLEITGSIGGTGGLTLAAGSTLRLDGMIGGGNPVLFNSGSAETLILNAPGSVFANAISGLNAKDRIEFGNGMTITAAAVVSPGTVEVDFHGSGGSPGTYDLTSVSFAGGSPQTFVTGHDATSGNDFIQVTCFAAGTRIATERGEVAVETLREGDMVVVTEGDALPVVWLGHRHVDCVRHPRPELVWPVRIGAGAFGVGRPERDLYVSPDHAVLVGDVLIPAKYLIDGEAIVQVQVARVTYWHVELPRHAVLLAEGLPVESYLDTGDRANFANGGERIALWPDFASRAWEARGCVPLVVSGPLLEAARGAIRRRERAGAYRSKVRGLHSCGASE